MTRKNKYKNSPHVVQHRMGTVFFYGDPGGIRTPDPRLRRPLLYPTELLNHVDLQKLLYHIFC